jgi:hypothetical protein
MNAGVGPDIAVDEGHLTDQCRTSHCSRQGRQVGVSWYEVVAAGPAAELCRSALLGRVDGDSPGYGRSAAHGHPRRASQPGVLERSWVPPGAPGVPEPSRAATRPSELVLGIDSFWPTTRPIRGSAGLIAGLPGIAAGGRPCAGARAGARGNCHRPRRIATRPLRPRKSQQRPGYGTAMSRESIPRVMV